MDYTSRIKENNEMRGHELLPTKLGPIAKGFGGHWREYTDENMILASLKYYTPDSDWFWYVIEFDGRDRLTGLVFTYTVDITEFSLKDLELMRGPFGLPVHRDLNFESSPLAIIKTIHYEDEKRRRERWRF